MPMPVRCLVRVRQVESGYEIVRVESDAKVDFPEGVTFSDWTELTGAIGGCFQGRITTPSNVALFLMFVDDCDPAASELDLDNVVRILLKNPESE